MLSKATTFTTIIDNEYASVRCYETPYSCKVLWLGIKVYSYTPTQIDVLCYILRQCLEKATVPLILYFEHLTEHNADVPDFEAMKQIVSHLFSFNHLVKRHVKLTIFQPKILDTLTKTGFQLLSTIYTVNNLYISDNVYNIDEYANNFVFNKNTNPQLKA